VEEQGETEKMAAERQRVGKYVERKDMRDDGRGILYLPGGRDLRDKERKMKLNGE
jgi:hypothetical protein